ncbi:MAG: sigma-70 family RNA polymerase sigma factor [Gemmatimonadaceae bacterium]
MTAEPPIPPTPPTALAPDAGRDADFERVALPWMNDVYRFAFSLTRNESDAEDLVQETYLRAFRSWHTFQPGSDARRWLFTICRNAFLRSRERTRREVELEDGDEEAYAIAARHAELLADGTDRVLSQIDLRPALTSALEQLQEPFRSTVILVDVEDQSYDAAAEILGVPIGTVRSRLFRGRRQLQERLAVYAKDAGFVSAGSDKETRSNG